MSSLSAWGNFFVIVGSSAGALTGLTFVVISISAQMQGRALDRGIAAFNTPTTVDFGAVLLVCALLSAPWTSFVPPAVLLGVCGVAGLIYTYIILRRQRAMESMETYLRVLEDVLAYTVGPAAAYVALLVAAILLPAESSVALFVIGGAALLLLFIGIHNAWDVVTYITVHHLAPSDKPEERQTS